MFKKVYILFMLFSVVLLGSCTVGPDYARPVTAADEADTFVNAADQRLVTDRIDPWWTHFGDPLTSELVREALENNNSLKAAAANVLKSKALLDRTHGTRLPDVSVSGNRTRTKSSFEFIGGQRFGSYITSYSGDASVSYIVDLFGGLKRAEQAAMADFLSAGATHEALTHAIVSQVVKARVQISKYQRLLNIAKANTKNWKTAFKIVERRYNAGLIGPLDVHLTKENLAASQSLEPQLAQSLILAAHSLDVLLGRRPAASELLPETLPQLPELGDIPAGLPAGLLDRRPDVRASEMQLASATEQVGISIAALYPSFNLTATGGYRSSEFSSFTRTGADVYSFIIGLSAPIWKGGQLRAQVDFSRASVKQAVANYADTVLVALREVEDALVKHQKLSERYRILKVRLAESLSAERLARQRYLRGLEGILIVLDTERRRRIAENLVVETASQLFNARIDLFLALGGDWAESRSAQRHNADNELGTTSDPGVTDG